MTTILGILLSYSMFTVIRLTRRVDALEAALAHLTPDHRLDAFVKQNTANVAQINSNFQNMSQAIKKLEQNDVKFLEALAMVKNSADATYFRKDRAH